MWPALCPATRMRCPAMRRNAARGAVARGGGSSRGAGPESRGFPGWDSPRPALAWARPRHPVPKAKRVRTQPPSSSIPRPPRATPAHRVDPTRARCMRCLTPSASTCDAGLQVEAARYGATRSPAPWPSGAQEYLWEATACAIPQRPRNALPAQAKRKSWRREGVGAEPPELRLGGAPRLSSHLVAAPVTGAAPERRPNLLHAVRAGHAGPAGPASHGRRAGRGVSDGHMVAAGREVGDGNVVGDSHVVGAGHGIGAGQGGGADHEEAAQALRWPAQAAASAMRLAQDNQTMLEAPAESPSASSLTAAGQRDPVTDIPERTPGPGAQLVADPLIASGWVSRPRRTARA